jgi:putative permease
VNLLKTWFRRHLSNPQVVILGMVLLIGFLVIALFGKILAPVLASLILAYMLEGVVSWVERLRIPRMVGVLLVYIIFLAALLFALFALLPMLSRQVGQLVQQIPNMISSGQQELLRLPERYPEVISKAQVVHLTDVVQKEAVNLGQGLLGLSVEGVRSLITVLIYLVLVPLLVFFFLKDKDKIHGWFLQFLPEDRDLTSQVWSDVDRQIGNYIRGKVWEILLVWVASYVTFVWLELDYAMLLSLFVGLSVLVPYIGATVMVIPIAIIGYFDFGFTKHFAYVMVAYGIIQTLDGNLLAPLLLSEVVNLHPVAVIVAVLVFGGVWGFWGVFFAIPLATLVQAVIKAWPRPVAAAVATDPPPPAETPSDADE